MTKKDFLLIQDAILESYQTALNIMFKIEFDPDDSREMGAFINRCRDLSFQFKGIAQTFASKLRYTADGFDSDKFINDITVGIKEKERLLRKTYL